MHAELQANLAFHLTGRKAGKEADTPEELGLRPALLAAYHDLTRLRYDFPLVLRAGAAHDRPFESLAALFDGVLEQAARPGTDADRLREYARRLERELRAIAASGAGGSLAAQLKEAELRLANSASAVTAESLGRLRRALEDADGEVVDCGASMPARVVEHVWRQVQQQKASAFRRNIDRLIVRLGEILRADLACSEAGRSPASLRASVGTVYGDAFDFEAMSRFLVPVSANGALSESRRHRIEGTLAALESQRFYSAPGAEALTFQFDSCAAALQAFRERVPDMMRLAKAITVAELEIQGEFSGPRHDALFEQLTGSALDLQDLALFPDYLVCVGTEDVRAQEHDALQEILAGGLPVKILLQSDDILGEPLRGTGHVAVGARSRQLTSMAIGLNRVYVLQASGSHLAKARDRVLGAMRYSGPALLSVFSGATGYSEDLPPYLVAAAAVESRAFPAFTYDPAAGPDWASRLDLYGNPQAELDWPRYPFTYEDAAHQGVLTDQAFTLLDFFALDVRYAGDFAEAPRASMSASLVPAVECVSREAKGVPDKLPSLLMVDRDNRLHKVIVDDRLVREARHCREMWRALQELGGIHNSHAERLLARERKRWDEARQGEARAPATAGEVPAAAATRPVAVPAAADETDKERPPDEPYIETPRCSSCDECIQINSKMFAYDANKQARIVDPGAGTYRQLVEAAESCQVAIIHPGKPRNSEEPDLDELLKRAEPFL